MALSGVTKQKRKSALPRAQSSDDSDVDGDSSVDAHTNEAEGNSGWADCIAKVLNTSKPKKKKTLVLSRAKKVKLGDKVKSKTLDYGFEVEGEQKVDEKEEIDEQIKQRKNVPLELRVKPSWKDMERERTLRKVATRGVVQLFNAVRIQQKDIQRKLEEAGPLDSRKDAVLNNINKRKFIDVLMSGNRAKSEAIDNSVKNEALKEEESSDEASDNDATPSTQRRTKSEWNVLQADFMTNKKNKHWDEDDEDENNEESIVESDDE
ncbi:RRP15-like protein [Eurosta solidaginis]|uniref:RRP15-like protein n=1 Tax=Eurosta solidaginis TaxID=178769 RepID=UPI00353056B7